MMIIFTAFILPIHKYISTVRLGLFYSFFEANLSGIYFQISSSVCQLFVQEGYRVLYVNFLYITTLLNGYIISRIIVSDLYIVSILKQWLVWSPRNYTLLYILMSDCQAHILSLPSKMTVTLMYIIFLFISLWAQ